MKILILLVLVCGLAWSAHAETAPPDLRLGYDEVRIDLSDPASLRTILNQLALNEGWEGPWWRALTEAESAQAAMFCPPSKQPIAVVGIVAFCVSDAETLKADPVFTRDACTVFDRRYAGFPDPTKPFMLVCRKPVI